MRDPRRLVGAYRALAASCAEQPWCVIHGDPHVGNVYLDAARQPGLLDWQLVQRGVWSIDVGYHIASALSVEQRQEACPDLLRHYLDCLRSFGIEPPPWQEAWAALSRGVLHGFFLWSITTKVEPQVIEILLRRLGTAAAEFDVFRTAEVAR
ncbi:phosphotransferase [Mycolicibacterium aichiense]|uniref:phosphotransferase n=1 Tax=Mycolicibacterium aichiense TaxID=1799 RepID=UPI003D67E339